MKRITIAFLLLTLSLNAFAQESDTDRKITSVGAEPFIIAPKHAVSFTYGFFPIDGTTLNNLIDTDVFYTPDTVRELYEDSNTGYRKGYLIGSFGLNYLYSSKKKSFLDMEVCLAVSAYSQGRYNLITGNNLKNKVGITILAMYQWDFAWFRKPNVTMYSGIGVGIQGSMGFETRNNKLPVLPAIQLDAVCIRFGGRVYGDVALGVGARSCIRFGIGYIIK
ncbi:MAG: hypothetical protein HUJ95_00375 [Bacteroidales bacterium]|nr:hypothetical protein [Bacteroidales bacterium]